MTADLRASFHISLEELDHKLASMFDLVADSLSMLTGAGRADWPAVVAARDARLVPDASTERQAAFAAMADQAAAMWRSVAGAYRRRDGRAAAELERQDMRMDDLQRSVLAGLAADALEPRCAVNLALLARFYERLGDHAVHLAKRIRFMVLGDSGEAA